MSAVAKRENNNLQVVSGSAPIAERHDEIAENVILKGNLYELTSTQRVQHYLSVCQSIGLNPFTQPLGYYEFDGGKDGDGNKVKTLQLYVKRDGAEQLRKLNGVSVQIVDRSTVGSIHTVTARATTADGRTDESIGVVPIGKEGGAWKENDRGRRFFEADGTFVPLAPNDLANALMKAETKAKRRVTLSICGLGFMDETELETIPGSRRVSVMADSGEIIETQSETPPSPEQLLKLAMDSLHAQAGERDVTHEMLHELAVNAYGVASLNDCTSPQLNGLRLTLKECSNDQFADVMTLADALSGADDKPYLDSVLGEVERGDLPNMAKRLLIATAKRVGEGLT